MILSQSHHSAFGVCGYKTGADPFSSSVTGSGKDVSKEPHLPLGLEWMSRLDDALRGSWERVGVFCLPENCKLPEGRL